MADLLPTKPDTSAVDDTDPRVVGLDSEDADDLIDALSSGTARQVLSELHEEPTTPSEVADRVDTSLQNVQYHLGNLEDAGVIEVVDTVYSEKGREMEVYAPADRPLVVFAGGEDEAGGIRTALSRLLGGLGILALGSLVLQTVLGGGLFPSNGATGGGGGDGGGPGIAEKTTAADGGGPGIAEVTTTATGDGGAEITTTAVDAGASAAAGLPPGLLFFLGGASVLLAVFGIQYLRTR